MKGRVSGRAVGCEGSDWTAMWEGLRLVRIPSKGASLPAPLCWRRRRACLPGDGVQESSEWKGGERLRVVRGDGAGRGRMAPKWGY